MTGDAVWYEAAFVVGMTNALNVVADGLPAGALILTGGLTASVPLERGDFIEAECGDGGAAGFRVR